MLRLSPKLAALGPHPQVSLGFGIDPAIGDGPAYLVVSFLLFHVRIRIPFSQTPPKEP